MQIPVQIFLVKPQTGELYDAAFFRHDIQGCCRMGKSWWGMQAAYVSIF